MTPQRLADLRDDEFDALIEQHIDRVATGARARERDHHWQAPHRLEANG